ncbi:LacI family DNA-binding transcriptional regulator [Neiella sp. HB171785]|uniref:LacI family DNA-binding transcriptional regulator n=1 Tax=Neiella litorisoli TaxID=2771431 RepID=A0A8J6QFC4_9GAMM|nr:LacI family DNA-binding transcriptional regulator [Neiella litorisoli]MBD1388674.1 LacI family DNA-binding transcriptional regulator [Neiella litorisoli]
MTTIKDIAKVAGVSTATVSRVVNNGPKVGPKTRDKIIQIMHELGYTPNANARALVTRKSKTIGVVIPEISDPFFASLATGVEQVARETSNQLLLSTGKISAQTELEAIQLLIEQRCDIIIAHSKLIADDTLVELCQQIPGFVLIDRHIEAVKDKCIWLDNIEGGRIAARHLLSLGHQQLAVINSHYEIEDPYLRLQGFREEVEHSGIEASNEPLIVKHEPSLRGGELAAQALIASGKPFSAIFAYNDAMAIGAISVLEANGYRVPQDVSVLGFDDVMLSQYSRPKLTTLRYPIQQMAKHAAQLARAMALGQPLSTAASQSYVPELIQRDSVKPLPSSS